jgi:DNA-binding NarL/FixJ family response regulator
MIKVLICDDQSIVSTGLTTILGSSSEIQVLGTAADGAEAVQKAAQLQPDVVLMDLKMPIMNGIEATALVHKEHPHIKVLVLTTYDADEWVFDAIRSGAAGYLLKDTPPQALIQAVLDTAAGKNHLDPTIAGRLMDQFSSGSKAAPTTVNYDLNERETQVLTLLANGATNPTIAKELYLSEGTVRNIVSSILLKLGVEDRTQAAVLAIKQGIVRSHKQ